MLILDRSEPHLIGIAAQSVPDAWPMVVRFLENAVARPGVDFGTDTIYRDLLERDSQLWVADIGGEITGACITRLEKRPRRKVAVVVALGGNDMNAWMPFGRYLERWAAEHDCGAMEAAGRVGWARVLDKFGWRQTAVVMRKELYNA